MKARLERYLTGIWYGPSRPPLFLRMLVPLYRSLAARGWRRPPERPPCPVVVVGNITAGGSGKTPVVAALARVLREAGHAPAIISRGYGGSGAKTPRPVSASGDPAQLGDEPVLLARRAGCPVWVCRNRRAALSAARRGGADVVLADDGLQHPRLPRSFEICVVDGQRGLGNGWLLPAGPLRQPEARLDSVEYVLLKRAGDGVLQGPGIPFAIIPDRPYRLGDSQADDQPTDAVFDAVCAIGNPSSFFQSLEALGYTIRRRPFPDHHVFSAEELRRLPGPLLVTEKDAVKLERLADLPETWVLPVTAELPEELLQGVLAHVREFSGS